MLAKETSAGADYYWNTSQRNQLLIATSWGSGSTFLDEVLSHHPAVFHHYEPLTHLGAHQVRGGSEAVNAIDHVKDLLRCKYILLSVLL